MEKEKFFESQLIGKPITGELYRAHGKCLIAGGYAILMDGQPGLVLASPHYFEADIKSIEKATTEIEVIVSNPQFLSSTPSSVTFDRATRTLTSKTGNPFTDNAVYYALLALTLDKSTLLVVPSRISVEVRQTGGFLRSQHRVKLREVAREGELFPRYSCGIGEGEKTGLGSSAAYVTSVVGSLMCTFTRYLHDDRELIIELVSQVAHNAAQCKIGSGFDVSAAVYGSHVFKRLNEELSRRAEMMLRGEEKAHTLQEILDMCGTKQRPPSLELPGMRLVMAAFSGGTDTRIAVRQVLQYLGSDLKIKSDFLETSKYLVEQIESAISSRRIELLSDLCRKYRSLMKNLGVSSKVEIEPNMATSVLDSLIKRGAFFAVCPGAGGFDALAILVDENTTDTTVIGSLEEIAHEIGSVSFELTN